MLQKASRLPLVFLHAPGPRSSMIIMVLSGHTPLSQFLYLQTPAVIELSKSLRTSVYASIHGGSKPRIGLQPNSLNSRVDCITCTWPLDFHLWELTHACLGFASVPESTVWQTGNAGLCQFDLELQFWIEDSQQSKVCLFNKEGKLFISMHNGRRKHVPPEFIPRTLNHGLTLQADRLLQFNLQYRIILKIYNFSMFEGFLHSASSWWTLNIYLYCHLKNGDSRLCRDLSPILV